MCIEFVYCLQRPYHHYHIPHPHTRHRTCALAATFRPKTQTRRGALSGPSSRNSSGDAEASPAVDVCV